MDLVWRFIVSFFIGAIPFAKVAMIGTGIDITKVGSKNPGFNNVLRVSSKWRAAIALIGDIAKGFIALFVLGGSWLIGIAGCADLPDADTDNIVQPPGGLAVGQVKH